MMSSKPNFMKFLDSTLRDKLTKNGLIINVFENIKEPMNFCQWLFKIVSESEKILNFLK